MSLEDDWNDATPIPSRAAKATAAPTEAKPSAGPGTSLSPAEQPQYDQWRKTLPPRLQSDADYDLKGFWKKNPKWSLDSPDAHMTDEFKLPNHPTFSNESKYYNDKTAPDGGHWMGDVYIPNDVNRKQFSDETPGADPNDPPPAWLSKSKLRGAGHGRGDELTQPDPSPSGPVTAPSPKPLVDVTGSVARTQGEIRKGAPGEPLADAEARAHATEEQGNPIKDDWIAKELITGAVAGPTLGLATKAMAGPARRLAASVADSSAGRQAGRALEKIATGAGKRLSEALGEVAPEAKAMLKAEPWLAEGKTSAEVAKNFAAKGKQLAAQREHLFELADARAIDRAGAVPEAVEGEETAAMTSPNATPSAAPNVASETGYLPKGGRATATSENATQRLEAPNFTPETGAPAEAASTGGVPLSLVAEKIDARIAKLAEGTSSEREVAAHMEKRASELEAHHGEAGAIPSSQLRRQMSDYQTAFDKTASATATRADKEMSKALGDALDAHVADPKLKAQIDALTDQMSVTTRAEKALRAKAKAEAAPGAPGHGIVSKLVHDVSHSHGTPNAVARVGKRLLSPAASAADRALGGLARRVDPAMAAIINRGAAEHWSAARLAQEITSSRAQ